MRTDPRIPQTLMKAIQKALEDPSIDRAGFCDLKRNSWTLISGHPISSDPSGSIWQALGDCYSVLDLQRLPCRHIHWVLDTGSVAGVHHKKMGTLGLISKSHIPAAALETHMTHFESALDEAAL